jgi:hypothetical protein
MAGSIDEEERAVAPDVVRVLEGGDLSRRMVPGELGDAVVLSVESSDTFELAGTDDDLCIREKRSCFEGRINFLARKGERGAYACQCGRSGGLQRRRARQRKGRREKKRENDEREGTIKSISSALTPPCANTSSSSALTSASNMSYSGTCSGVMNVLQSCKKSEKAL